MCSDKRNGLSHSNFTFCGNFCVWQGTPYSEEYMEQYDGGHRAEYLQEMENSDPEFYVPPVNDAGFSAATNNSRPAN
ncbi:MAG: hypothetical protein M3219_02200 [Thermoproteota archaeon]|nr:hypothetical protein [Thermoproteota archaeon]